MQTTSLMLKAMQEKPLLTGYFILYNLICIFYFAPENLPGKEETGLRLRIWLKVSKIKVGILSQFKSNNSTELGNLTWCDKSASMIMIKFPLACFIPCI